jgi:ssDNA-binding Zn-finger/Zn-ribbon topoisomerase 1
MLNEWSDAGGEGPETTPPANAEKCPMCGASLVERCSRFGSFFGCSTHPKCKYIKKIEDTDPSQ